MQTAPITVLIYFLSLLFLYLLITNVISKQREVKFSGLQAVPAA